MKLITRDADYAVRALCYIARRKKETVSVRELVLCLRIPRPFLRKILQRLTKSGLLQSLIGKGGGFALSRPADKISVADILGVFQDPGGLNRHVFKKGKCPHIKTCPLKKRLDGIERYVMAELKAVSIAGLIKERRAPR